MTRSARQSRFSAILLGSMLAASGHAAAHEVTDSSITAWVKEALRNDLLVRGSEISVSTEEGIVTLPGRVDDLSVMSDMGM